MEHIRRIVEDNDTESGLGRLFAREAATIRDKLPLYKCFPSMDDFIVARIMWRLDKLRCLATDAERELENLQERIGKREDP